MGPILEATFCGWGYIPRSRGNFYILSKPSSGQNSSPKLRRFISIWSVQSFSMKHHAVSWFARPRNNGPFSCYNLILGNIFKVPSLGRWTKHILYYLGHIIIVSIFDRKLRFARGPSNGFVVVLEYKRIYFFHLPIHCIARTFRAMYRKMKK